MTAVREPSYGDDGYRISSCILRPRLVCLSVLVRSVVGLRERFRSSLAVTCKLNARTARGTATLLSPSVKGFTTLRFLGV